MRIIITIALTKIKLTRILSPFQIKGTFQAIEFPLSKLTTKIKN